MALGLFAGLILPIGQIVVAALLALSARANVLVAAGATLVTNPLTFPPIYFLAYRLGCSLTGAGRVHPAGSPPRPAMATWLFDIAAPTAAGLVFLAFVVAGVGYALVHVGWRWRVGRRWQQRQRRRRMLKSAPLSPTAAG